MKCIEIEGRLGSSLKFNGVCIARVEALNHDDTVRCLMSLYKTESGYVCHRIDNPGSIDSRSKFERCLDELSVYQFFGTEPLANFLYGSAGITVPGLRQKYVTPKSAKN